LGNFGLNTFYKATTEKPVEIFAKDFDTNGTYDPVITHYVGKESFVIHPKSILTDLIPAMAFRFETFSSYGKSTLEQTFTKKELQGATHLQCYMLESIIMENVEGQYFQKHRLPLRAQNAPIYGIQLEDLNNDNRPDILAVGNCMSDETVSGYQNSSYGHILINKGSFSWKALPTRKTGFVADDDKKALVKLFVQDQPMWIISENSGPTEAFSSNKKIKKTVRSNSFDWSYILEYQGLKRKIEIYRGSGYLSSTSRLLEIPEGVKSLTVESYTGESRLIE
jgi:hypothetical protein